jgi:proteasome accessory factor B
MAGIDPAERLLNLIIALTHARTRMTRAQIRASVAGYEPAPAGLSPEDAARREAAFERMFERDKDDLRRMGIPLQTVVDAAHGDEIGYRIDPSNAAMGAIDLTPAELAVVALAAEFWSDATVGADARQALTKVASGSAPRIPVDLPFAARSAASSDAIVVLAEAIQRRHAVTFEYASASASAVSRRTLEPWHIAMRGGAQYVTGFDRDRAEARTFRLSRILGVVKATGADEAYSIPDPLPPGDHRGERPVKTARIALRPESGHVLRERGILAGHHDGWDLVDVEYRYADAVRDQVLALGGAARVVSPAEIAQEVIDHARSALEVSRG